MDDFQKALALDHIRLRYRVQIRYENENDRAGVQAVNEAAFDTAAEASLVNALREQARPVISLVADNR